MYDGKCRLVCKLRGRIGVCPGYHKPDISPRGYFGLGQYMVPKLFKSMDKGVALTVSAVSMIRSPQATGAPTSIITVPLTGLPYLKKGPEGILIQGPLRASYDSAHGPLFRVKSCPRTPF
ncbi:hypothetical protein TNCV_3394621 [Trichonephila clavipes]|nr:hypothetical protein TNCV_3394621 [Trichonephila clavipes]